jgi:hypothetical protein
MQGEAMNWYRKVFFSVLAGVTLSLLLCTSAIAEGPADLTVQDQTMGAPAPPKATTADDDNWHFMIAPYLWFPGMSGTVGALGHDASVHVSASDVLSNFNFGIMGAVEARRNRLIVPVDYMYVRLNDNKGLPETDFGLTSVTVRVTESILTPKVGFRFADTERWKADALFGIRYWHLGESLTLNPSGLQVSPSVNWVDFNLGLRVQAMVTPKMVITIFGDEGAGGSRLDYQVGGLLGYRIKPTVALQLGWRYLDVDYRGSGDKRFIYDAHQSGPILGITFDVK